MGDYDAETQQYFDREARVHSRVPERAEFAADFLAEYVQRRAELLAIGIGTGEEVGPLSETGNVAAVTGLDVSTAGLRSFAETTPRSCPVCGTATGLPFSRESFDAVTAFSLFHHLVGSSPGESRKQMVKSLDEMLRVLRPGGYVFVYEPTFWPQWFSDVVFYCKKVGTRLTGGERMDVKWVGNFGAPVTAFLAPKQLKKLLTARDCAGLRSYVEDTVEKPFAFGAVRRTTVKAVLEKVD